MSYYLLGSISNLGMQHC